MSLVITSIRNTDFGKYKCVAKNPRGQTDGTISLYGKVHTVHSTRYTVHGLEEGVDAE